MTATNHALTGAVIGLAIVNPWLAVPLAFASHFVLDAIPHFGVEHRAAKWLRSKKFRYLLIAEFIVCTSLVGLLFLSGNSHWLIASVCAFVATSPDLFWIGRFRDALKKKKLKTSYQNPLLKLHQNIQWFQKPIGWIVEVAWAILCITLLSGLLATP